MKSIVVQKSSRFFLPVILFGAISFYVVGTPHAQPTPRPIESLVSALLTSSQETGGEITRANWQQHPKIRAIRNIVQMVKAGMMRKSFVVRKRTFEYCEPYADVERVLATDARGRARFYQTDAGSDDSALKTEHYYDEAGQLRFVFITGGAANGAKLEHRIYFDEAGKRIWEEQTYQTEMQYTFPVIWPDDQLQITGAAGKFSSTSPCPEVKPRGAKRRRSGR